MFLFGLVILGLGFASSWNHDSVAWLQESLGLNKQDVPDAPAEDPQNDGTDKNAAEAFLAVGYERCLWRLEPHLPESGSDEKYTGYLATKETENRLASVIATKNTDRAVVDIITVAPDVDCSTKQMKIRHWKKGCDEVMGEAFTGYTLQAEVPGQLRTYLKNTSILTAMSGEGGCVTVATEMASAE